jgi:molybdopterin-guanine dinucleotide biosynthesis protein A
MVQTTRIAAVILAGGKAERLGGVNKALLEIGGTRLVDRALDSVWGCDPILLSVGRIPFEVPGSRQVFDLDTDYGGPLAGLAAAVTALGETDADALLSLAVDTPFFPHDFLERAATAFGPAPAVVAAFAGQDYPTNGLWRLNALKDLPSRLRNGTAPRSLKRLADDMEAVRLDYAELTPENPFANANTPDDLAVLRARAERESSG